MADIPLHAMNPSHKSQQQADSSDSEEGDARDGNGEDEGNDFVAANNQQPQVKHIQTRLFASFLIFGLLNNVLYVIILSAALDLVPATTPKGVVALFDIFPALLAKVVWPLVSNGTIRYGRRVAFCTCVSWLGIVIIALSASLNARLFGISLASLSSGLGELTFLQLTTTLPKRSASKTALGAWASGTGAAGIAGAGLWWLLRGLGVKGGLGISSVLPLFFPLTYRFLLPRFSDLAADTSGAYQPVPTFSAGADSTPRPIVTFADAAKMSHDGEVRLTRQEKWDLLKPLLLRFMLPLFAVYVEEYVINSGIAPTLVFPIPDRGIWSYFFRTPRDYYPLWSLTYQTFVFISRSSLSLGLPAIPKHYLPLPAIAQFLVLSLLALQSSHFIFSSGAYTPPAQPPSYGADRSISWVFLLICCEGLCGGSAYVNTFYHVGRESDDVVDGEEEGRGGGEGGGARRKMEREFRIGAVGAADSTGILFASLMSMPVEVALCNAQVQRGRTTCREL